MFLEHTNFLPPLLLVGIRESCTEKHRYRYPILLQIGVPVHTVADLEV